jgi:hypothetical protein
MKNLLTSDYNSLTLSERTDAIEKSYQEGREAALADLGASCGEICCCDAEKYWVYVVEPAWQQDICSDIEKQIWENKTWEIEGWYVKIKEPIDPRVKSFCKGWDEVMHEEA